MKKRLNVEILEEDYIALKMLCLKRGVSIKDFVIPLILKAIEDEENALLVNKAQNKYKNLNKKDLIPVEEAFGEDD